MEKKEPEKTKEPTAKPVNINFSGLGLFALPFMILWIPVMFVCMIAFVIFIIGIGIVAIPIGLVVFLMIIAAVKIIDWLT